MIYKICLYLADEEVVLTGSTPVSGQAQQINHQDKRNHMGLLENKVAVITGATRGT